MKFVGGAWFFSIFLIFSGFGLFNLPGLQRNLLSVEAARALLQQQGIEQALQRLEGAGWPRAGWQRARLAEQLNDPARSQALMAEFLASGDPAALELAHAMSPLDPTLASQAIQIYPERAEAWFWLGEALNQSADKAQAIAAYQKTVSLDPGDGLTWCRLGQLLRGQDALQARDAYLQCCYNGDPGSNGCVNAGGIEEELGNYQKAIQYYRRSRWADSLRRADELEARLATTP